MHLTKEEMKVMATRKRKAAEAQRRKAEADSKIRAEAEAKQRAEAESRARAEAEAKKKAEAEVRRRAEDEAEARRKAEDEAEAGENKRKRKRAAREASKRCGAGPSNKKPRSVSPSAGSAPEPEDEMEPIDFSTETHQESSIVSDQGARASGAGNSLVEDSCLEVPCRGISLDTSLNTIEEGKDLYLSGREAPILAASYNGCNRHNDSGAVITLDDGMLNGNKLEMRESGSPTCQDNVSSRGACLEGVMLLLRQAVESGRAVVLDDQSLDANIVFERSVALAKTAMPGPVFQRRVRKSSVQRTQKDKGDKIEEQDTEVEAVPVSEKRVRDGNNSRRQRRDDFSEVLSIVVPHGSLRVDELAKLLA